MRTRHALRTRGRRTGLAAPSRRAPDAPRGEPSRACSKEAMRRRRRAPGRPIPRAQRAAAAGALPSSTAHRARADPQPTRGGPTSPISACSRCAGPEVAGVDGESQRDAPSRGSAAAAGARFGAGLALVTSSAARGLCLFVEPPDRAHGRTQRHPQRHPVHERSRTRRCSMPPYMPFVKNGGLFGPTRTRITSSATRSSAAEPHGRAREDPVDVSQGASSG